MKNILKWGWKVTLSLLAAGALAGCADGGYVGYYGPDYYGPDYVYYGPGFGYWGGDYYAWGHHRYGRLDSGFAHRRDGGGFHGSFRGSEVAHSGFRGGHGLGDRR